MDGHTIYQGDAKNSIKHFSTLGYNCPEYSNPADYFLKVFSPPKSNVISFRF